MNTREAASSIKNQNPVKKCQEAIQSQDMQIEKLKKELRASEKKRLAREQEHQKLEQEHQKCVQEHQKREREHQECVQEHQKCNEELRHEVAYLREQLEMFQRRIFGKRSEKIVRDYSQEEQQLYFPGFDPIDVEKEERERETIAEHKRIKRKATGKDKIEIPDYLPVKEEIIDIPEDQKVCPKTGEPLVKIKEEITTKLAHVPESYYLLKIVRPIYGLPKGEGIVCAEIRESFLPRCQADESFLAEIVTRKFADHIPLNRMAEIFQRVYLKLSTQLLSQWVIKSAKGLKPIYDLMRRRILEEKVIFVDESPISVQVKGKGKTHTGYMWVMVGGVGKDPPYRYFDFSMNRKHENIERLIEDYDGILHSDKYGAYEALANRGQITWNPCYAHIRRKFVEAESGDPFVRRWIIEEIGKLFQIEKEAWRVGAEERTKMRQEKAVPIINGLVKKVKEIVLNGPVMPKSKYKEALGYTMSLIPYLKNYTKDAHSRIDNNIAERTIRSLAVGRKNWLFAGSEAGGEAAAILISIAQSCRAVGTNPREYFEDVMKRINTHPYSRLEELLPDKWTKLKTSQGN